MVVSGFFLKGGRLVDVRYSSTPPQEGKWYTSGIFQAQAFEIAVRKISLMFPKKTFGGKQKRRARPWKGLGGKLETVKGFASLYLIKVGTYTLED